MMKQAFLNEVTKRGNLDDRAVQAYVREMDHDGLWDSFDSLEELFEDYGYYQVAYTITFRR